MKCKKISFLASFGRDPQSQEDTAPQNFSRARGRLLGNKTNIVATGADNKRDLGRACDSDDLVCGDVAIWQFFPQFVLNAT